jgi:hypothetical protein
LPLLAAGGLFRLFPLKATVGAAFVLAAFREMPALAAGVGAGRLGPGRAVVPVFFSPACSSMRTVCSFGGFRLGGRRGAGVSTRPKREAELT